MSVCFTSVHFRITIVPCILGGRSYTTQQPFSLDKSSLIPSFSWGNLSVEDRFLQRKRSVLSNCAKFQQPLTENEKQMLYKNIVVDDRHRILYCPVSKACSTSWRKLMLVMSGKFRTLEEIGNPVQIKTSTESRLHTYSKEQQEYRLKNYVSFMVTREPLIRFVSTYKDKFSNPTLNGWRRRLCHDIVELVTSMGWKHNRGPRNISIDEFAEYVIDLAWNVSDLVQLKLNPHWRPMSIQCRPCHITYDYYSWVETIREDAEYLLKKFAAPPGLHFIWENQSPKTVIGHPKDGVKQYLSQLSERQLNQIISTYKADYEIFGYDRPRKH